MNINANHVIIAKQVGFKLNNFKLNGDPMGGIGIFLKNTYKEDQCGNLLFIVSASNGGWIIDADEIDKTSLHIYEDWVPFEEEIMEE